MARITVNDCVEIVSSRFDLIVLAAQRARQIAAGAPVTIARTNNKIPLIALREIASQTISTQELEDSVVRGFQRYCPQEDLEEDLDTLPTEESYDPHLATTLVDIDKTEVKAS
jgi:DNA-directed RNA polymerase subunit omega